ncbi:hypothetical protein BC827DRAFT_1267742 [Russula dissimulans]|nr:hypothetical protein BC827DRAFT_1267742 [Russula dissimulans]
MSLVSSPRRSSPEPLPSLLPSDEEDIGWDGLYDEPDQQGANTTERSQLNKGKANTTPYSNGDADEVSPRPKKDSGTEAYPPTTDEDADTRRVEENLRRWEIAERQRWKAARESATSRTSSVLADVARRASSLWSRRTSHPPADSGGKHHALQTSEDSAHLDEIEASASPATRSFMSAAATLDQPRTGPYSRTTNPFSDPSGSTSSLFVNGEPTTSDAGSTTFIELNDPESKGSSSSLPAKESNVVSAPAPLDLPEPLLPPPRTATPHANRPPEPFPRPDSRTSRASLYGNEDEKPVPWWTEWLCGCSEGSDRGGEVQAGRTNPLE